MARRSRKLLETQRKASRRAKALRDAEFKAKMAELKKRQRDAGG
jgi:hypothetical protein